MTASPPEEVRLALFGKTWRNLNSMCGVVINIKTGELLITEPYRVSSHCVVAHVQNCDIVISEFELQSHYYAHF